MATPALVVVSFPAIVGAILLAKRKELGISQAEMADAVGVNVSTWSRVENGDSAMTLEQLVFAAEALKLRPGSILDAAESKLQELNSRGIAAWPSRADMVTMSQLGAIPLAGSALVGALGPVGALAAGIASAYFFAKRKDK